MVDPIWDKSSIVWKKGKEFLVIILETLTLEDGKITSFMVREFIFSNLEKYMMVFLIRIVKKELEPIILMMGQHIILEIGWEMSNMGQESTIHLKNIMKVNG